MLQQHTRSQQFRGRPVRTRVCFHDGFQRKARVRQAAVLEGALRDAQSVRVALKRVALREDVLSPGGPVLRAAGAVTPKVRPCLVKCILLRLHEHNTNRRSRLPLACLQTNPLQTHKYACMAD